MCCQTWLGLSLSSSTLVAFTAQLNWVLSNRPCLCPWDSEGNPVVCLPWGGSRHCLPQEMVGKDEEGSAACGSYTAEAVYSRWRRLQTPPTRVQGLPKDRVHQNYTDSLPSPFSSAVPTLVPDLRQSLFSAVVS